MRAFAMAEHGGREGAARAASGVDWQITSHSCMQPQAKTPRVVVRCPASSEVHAGWGALLA